MIFIRHGQSTSNAVFYRTGQDPGLVDPVLTEVGWLQAEFAAERLSRMRVRRIISSPYKRALQTSGVLARRTGVPIFVEPLIGEHAIKPWEIGSPRSELKQCFPELALDHLPEIWWPQPGESEIQLRKRCDYFLLVNVIKTERLQETVIVTHWGFIRAWTSLEVPNCTILRVNEPPRAGATARQKQLAAPASARNSTAAS